MMRHDGVGYGFKRELKRAAAIMIFAALYTLLCCIGHGQQLRQATASTIHIKPVSIAVVPSRLLAQPVHIRQPRVVAVPQLSVKPIRIPRY